MDDFEIKIPHFKFKKPNLKNRKIIWLTIAVPLALFILYSLFIFFSNYPILSALDKPQNFTPKDIDKNQSLAEINQVIDLPTDEKGTFGIIKDVSFLAKKDSYFKKASNGDILIIYPNMTIIYDLKNHTVVDIAKNSLLK